MNVIIGTAVLVSYFIIFLRFFPAGKRTFDVFKLNPLLLPFVYLAYFYFTLYGFKKSKS
jgi:hypothetical protein